MFFCQEKNPFTEMTLPTSHALFFFFLIRIFFLKKRLSAKINLLYENVCLGQKRHFSPGEK